MGISGYGVWKVCYYTRGITTFFDFPAEIWYTFTMSEKKIPGYLQTPPDWCDDCNAAPGGECPDCGCTHNC